jgi:predicted metal-dependent phosphoesterase TrpH
MKIDLHTHTSYGSACAYMDPDQLVERAKFMGLDGVCITEHDQIWDVEALARLKKKHDFLVIGGVEVSTDCGEILVFGLHESVLNIFKAQDLKETVDEAGAVMILAHPFRYKPDLLAAYFRSTSTGESGTNVLETVCRQPLFTMIDALEVYNGHSGFDEVEFTHLVAERLHLKGAGGSDAHASLEVGSCYSFFEDDIRDEKDFLEQIKRGRFHGVDQRWSDLPYEIRSRGQREAF